MTDLFIHLFFQRVIDSKRILDFVPALIALIGTIFTIFFSWKTSTNQMKASEEMKNKELRINLLNKSRIEWLQSSRELNAAFVSATYELLTNKIIFTNEKKNVGFVKNEIKDNYGDAFNSFKSKYYLLKMFYPVIGSGDDPKAENIGNQEVMKKAEVIYNLLHLHCGDNSEAISNYEKTINKAIDEYVSLVSEYNKREWINIKNF